MVKAFRAKPKLPGPAPSCTEAKEEAEGRGGLRASGAPAARVRGMTDNRPDSKPTALGELLGREHSLIHSSERESSLHDTGPKNSSILSFSLRNRFLKGSVLCLQFTPSIHPSIQTAYTLPFCKYWKTRYLYLWYTAWNRRLRNGKNTSPSCSEPLQQRWRT